MTIVVELTVAVVLIDTLVASMVVCVSVVLNIGVTVLWNC